LSPESLVDKEASQSVGVYLWAKSASDVEFQNPTRAGSCWLTERVVMNAPFYLTKWLIANYSTITTEFLYQKRQFIWIHIIFKYLHATVIFRHTSILSVPVMRKTTCTW
jgi:hypothetical protein